MSKLHWQPLVNRREPVRMPVMRLRQQKAKLSMKVLLFLAMRIAKRVRRVRINTILMMEEGTLKFVEDDSTWTSFLTTVLF